MELTQPLKKRIVEVPTTATEQKETQRTSRIRQYCQYVPIAEVRGQPLDALTQPQTQRQRQQAKLSTLQRQQQKDQQIHQQKEQQIQQQKEQQQTQQQREQQRQPPRQTPTQSQTQPQTQTQRQSLTISHHIQSQLAGQHQAQQQAQLQTQQKSQTKNQSRPQSEPQSRSQSQSQTQHQSQPQTQPQTQPQPQPKPQAQPPSQPQSQPRSQLSTKSASQSTSQPQMQFRTPPSAHLQAQIQEHIQNTSQSQTQMSQTPTQATIGTLIEIPNRQEQQQPMETGIQIIEHIYKEPPMMLNAWTQTTIEDLQNAENIIGDLRTAVLLAKIETLQESLKESYDYINSNLNVTISPVSEEEEEEDPLPMSPPPVVKNEIQTYRILSQGNDDNNDIEIELSMEPEDVNDENAPPSPKVYKIRTAQNTDSPKATKKELSPKACGGSPKALPEGETYVEIGPNRTRVAEVEFNKIAWTSASIATRKLLTIIFDRETLATHSMTGKASPAFKDLDKPVKGRLDAAAVEDIIHIVSDKCGVSAKEVRSAITTKCADENKMLKLKEMKRLSGEAKRPILGELRPRNAQARKSNVN